MFRKFQITKANPQAITQCCNCLIGPHSTIENHNLSSFETGRLVYWQIPSPKTTFSLAFSVFSQTVTSNCFDFSFKCLLIRGLQEWKYLSGLRGTFIAGKTGSSNFCFYFKSTDPNCNAGVPLLRKCSSFLYLLLVPRSEGRSGL